jgi:hypothetical protein
MQLPVGNVGVSFLWAGVNRDGSAWCKLQQLKTV